MDNAIYTRPKTVRFDPDTFKRIEIDADNGGVTTSEYIRSLVMDAVSEIDLDTFKQTASDPDQACPDSMNLLQGLRKQMDRARDLRAAYYEIESGWFAAGAITKVIRQAERSIEDGCAADMLLAFKALEALE